MLTQKPMKILVTGGSGFLGRHVLKRLVSEGHQVIALARSGDAARVVEALGAQSLRGDVCDVHHFESGLLGLDAVVHCAAPVEFWGKWERFEREITRATLELAKACERAGIKRFIYISSESVLQASSPLLDVDEKAPLRNRGTYFVTDDEPATVREFFMSIFGHLGVPQPKISFPSRILWPIARILESIWKLARIQSAPPLTEFDLAFVSMPRRYELGRAREELGYQPIVSRAEGILKLS